MSKHGATVLVTGFPYVRERYFAMWRHVAEREQYQFLLPDRWTAKKGKVVFHPPEDERIRTTKTYFHDSQAPIIGGLLKGWMPAFPFRLWGMRKDVQLVYACSEPTLLATLYFAIFTKLLGKRLVLFSWENIPYENKFRSLSYAIHYALLTINLFLADGLVCGNPEGALIHRQYTKKPIAVIPMNGLDPDAFVRTKEKIFRGEDLSGRVVFSFIGALGFRKGVHVAVKAFERVVRHIQNARFIIAGSGEYEEQLHDCVRKSSARDRITMVPWLDSDGVKELLNASDVFLYPSIPYKGWAEQFGYSMAEASLMEIPVVATRSGSIAHVVRDGKTGILVTPNEASELADAMVRLGTDATLREAMGNAGRAYIMDEFSHTAVVRKFEEFFARVIT